MHGTHVLHPPCDVTIHFNCLCGRPRRPMCMYMCMYMYCTTLIKMKHSIVLVTQLYAVYVFIHVHVKTHNCCLLHSCSTASSWRVPCSGWVCVGRWRGGWGTGECLSPPWPSSRNHYSTHTLTTLSMMYEELYFSVTVSSRLDGVGCLEPAELPWYQLVPRWCLECSVCRSLDFQALSLE